MNKTASPPQSALFELNGRPSFAESLPMALQHLVAMIIGCITPSIIIAGVAGLDGEQSILLIQSGLFIAGVATILQLFPLFGRIGARLPMIMGVSFAYVPTLISIAGGYDIATLFGAQFCGGLAAIVFGIFISKLRRFFPMVVAGTVVFVIGLSLYTVAINYMAGGTSSPEYGSWQNWLVAFITLIVVLYLNNFATGVMKLASILFGIIVGYIVALCMGMVDFSPVENAAVVAAPNFLPFGMKFEASAVITMVIMFIVNSVQAIGDFSATTSGAMDRLPTDKELGDGIIGNGFASAVGSFLGGLPTATFSQNVGIVITTRVISRFTLLITALLILAASFFPFFGGALRTIPQCVLGGATLSVFASITMTGIKMIASAKLTPRVMSIVGISVAIGMGISMAPDCLAQSPQWVQTVFGSAVIDSTIVSVLLNLILPKTKEDMEEEPPVEAQK
ncbi:MAG: purine permease [Clostridia bacterium]|nr:purine permease [Clostridia bacterium]